MHKDFHLYGTYMAAEKAGYNSVEAKKIACAAQMVDEFGKDLIKENITVTPMIREVIEAILLNSKEQEIINIWIPFHFIPKNIPSSIQGSTFKKYRCGYGQNVIKTIINKIIQGVIDDDRQNVLPLETIGILMHVLADSFAHQEFSAYPCKNYDSVYNVKCFILSEILELDNIEHVPSHLPYQAYFGHGCVGHLPDLSWVQYEYTWASGETQSRNNPEIFADAYTKMVKNLYRFKGTKIAKNERETIKTDIQDYINQQSFEIQKDNYNALMKKKVIDAANELFNKEYSSISPDLKGKYALIKEKLKGIKYKYEQIVKDDKDNYQIKDFEKTAFDLLDEKPVLAGKFDEESDNLFEQKCDKSAELKNAYEEYKKQIQNEYSEEYQNFNKSVKKYLDVYKAVING